MPRRHPPPAVRKCDTIFPCDCPCPGISLYPAVTASGLSIPSIGVSGGPYTLNAGYMTSVFSSHVPMGGCGTLGPNCVPFTQGDVAGCCCPLQGCCDCSCGFQIVPDGLVGDYDPTTCSASFPACADLADVTIPGGGGKIQDMKFGAPTPSPSSCLFTLTLVIVTCPGYVNWAAAPCFAAAFVFDSVDWNVSHCKCPLGLHLVFKGARCDPGTLGGWSDPDATVTVSAAETGPPCPTDWPCPPDDPMMMSDAEVYAALLAA